MEKMIHETSVSIFNELGVKWNFVWATRLPKLMIKFTLIIICTCLLNKVPLLFAAIWSHPLTKEVSFHDLKGWGLGFINLFCSDQKILYEHI